MCLNRIRLTGLPAIFNFLLYTFQIPPLGMRRWGDAEIAIAGSDRPIESDSAIIGGVASTTMSDQRGPSIYEKCIGRCKIVAIIPFNTIRV